MKIVHVINYFQHQLGYQEYFLAKEEVKAGHEVYVLTSNKYFPFPDYQNTAKSILGNREFYPGEEEIEGFKVIRLKGIFEQEGRRIWLKGLAKKIIQIKPDYILSHGEATYSTFLLATIKPFFKWKFVVDSHSHNHENIVNKISLKSVIVNFLTKRIILKRKSIKIVATTEWNKQYLLKTYKLTEDDIALIPNGSETDRFKPDTGLKSAMRIKYNIPSDKTVIVYSGKISEEKDPLKIIDALKDEIPKPDFLLLLIGNIQSDYSKKYELYSNNYRKYIMHIPAVKNTEIHNYYIMSDIACWPNQSSMSAIDAISSGLPIVVVSELKERLAYENGFGIDQNNINTLRDALTTLIANKDIRERMGCNSRKFAEEELNWKSTSEKFINITEE